LSSERREFGADGERLVAAPPPLAFVDAAAQRVHQRVEVGAHPQAEQRDVIAGVADDREGHVAGIMGPGTGRKMVDQAPEESGAADTTGQGSHVHGGILAARAAAARPACRAGIALVSRSRLD
jgi:hypothetical protein